MTRDVELSDAAYNCLAAYKRDGETFSDAVLGLTDDPSLLELAGILDDEAAEALRKSVDERRSRRRDDLETVTDEFRQA